MAPKRSLPEPANENEISHDPDGVGKRLRSFKYDAQNSDDNKDEPPSNAKTHAHLAQPQNKDRRRQQSLLNYAVALRDTNERSAPSTKYVPPSRYAHLPYLNDVLAPDLLVLFIGLNPGITTAQRGHAYAHPSNLFWTLLHLSGCTDQRCDPQQDVDMPELYSLGFTNIVSRPSKTQSELSRKEMVAGTPVLEEKARQWKPEACCLVGKGIWEAVYEWKYGKKLSKADFCYGWQDEKHNMGKDKDWKGARVFVAASTSGLSASLRQDEKEAIWRPLGEWVERRRKERAVNRQHDANKEDKGS